MGDFKVETKPCTWHIKFQKGCYSDYTEEHLFIYANTKDEVWYFLKKYLEQTRNDNVFSYTDYSIEVFNDEYGKIEIPPTENYKGSWTPSKEYNAWDNWHCEMEMLPVIHFSK